MPVRPPRGRPRPPRSSSAIPNDRELGSRARQPVATRPSPRGAYPLLVAYLALLILYAWQTTKHSTPWLFTDELQWAELSRGVAHHGVPQLRLHDVAFSSLYSYFIAPAWWLGATAQGYAAVKYLNAIADDRIALPRVRARSALRAAPCGDRLRDRDRGDPRCRLHRPRRSPSPSPTSGRRSRSGWSLARLLPVAGRRRCRSCRARDRAVRPVGAGGARSPPRWSPPPWQRRRALAAAS